MNTARITLDVTFDPDAISVVVDAPRDIGTLELLGILEIAKADVIDPITESVPT